MVLVMVVNMGVSSLALMRYAARGKGVEATQSWEVWMDTHYDDAVMERIYPNAKQR